VARLGSSVGTLAICYTGVATYRRTVVSLPVDVVRSGGGSCWRIGERAAESTRWLQKSF